MTETDATEKKFNPLEHVRTMSVQGNRNKPYLPALAKLRWLRKEHPAATFDSVVVELTPDKAVFHATISLPNGARASSVGTEWGKDDKGAPDPKYVEKAETSAYSRCATWLGFDLDSAEDEFDTPVSAGRSAPPAPPPRPPAPPQQTVAPPPRPAPAPAPSGPEEKVDDRKTHPRSWEKTFVIPTFGYANNPKPERTDDELAAMLEETMHAHGFSVIGWLHEVSRQERVAHSEKKMHVPPHIYRHRTLVPKVVSELTMEWLAEQDVTEK